MKKLYSLVASVVFALSVSAQAYSVTYDFEGAPPATSGAVTGANYSASDFSGVGYSQTSTGNRYAWTNAPTANVPDTGKYLQVTVSPDAGYKMTVSSVGFRAQRSGTGPRYYAVRSSVDNYNANLAASISPANGELEVLENNQFHFVNDISTGQNGSVVTPGFDAQTGPITFRFYFYGAEAVTGTFSVDDVVISGVVDTVLGTVDATGGKVNLVKNTSVSNELIFGAKSDDVKVLNLNGQVVKSLSAVENGRVNVSSLPKGVYIVTGTVNGKAVSQKIIKK